MSKQAKAYVPPIVAPTDFNNTLAEAATKIALRLGTDATQAISDMTAALDFGMQ